MADISHINKKYLRDAFLRAGKELGVPDLEASELQFEAIDPIDNHPRAAYQINTSNPHTMGWLEVYTGKLTIVNLADPDTNKNYKEIAFIDETLARKYTGTGITKLDQGTETENGKPKSFWQVYTNGTKQYTFKDINLAEDIRLENSVGFLRDRPFPQVKVSDASKHTALQILADSGVKGVRFGGSNSFAFDGETTVSIHAFGSDNNVYNITIRGEGDYRIYKSEDGGEIYTHELSGRMDIGNMKEHAPNANKIEQSPEKQKEYKEYSGKFSLKDPSPLQTLIIWTEIESKHKAAFAKDPYSVKRYESYICPAGVPTCGFGSTGKEFAKTMTPDQAYVAMNKHIDYQRASLRNQLGEDTFDKLKPREQDALISLSYNAGILGDGLVSLLHKYAKNPTEHNESAVTDKMMEYCKYRKTKGGPLEVSPGLQNRRSIEVALFTGDIDDITSHQFRNLGPPEAKTRRIFENYCNGSGGKVASSDKPNEKDTAANEIRDEFKQQGVEPYSGQGFLPKEVMDNALAQVKAQIASQEVSRNA